MVDVQTNGAARMKFAMAAEPAAIPMIEGDLIYRDYHLAMAREEFWFESPGHVRFHYRSGGHVSVNLPDEVLRGEMELYLWGTVHGAVAWYNGLLPLHASAVSRADRVIGFTADSGGGKSTLAAALVKHGYRHFCDDTLVVDPAGETAPTCLPDDKPLKLWNDALTQLDVEVLGPVATVPDKFYAKVANREARALPLHDLVFLQDGETLALEPIRGAEKLGVLPEAMYRNFIHAARGDSEFHVGTMLNVAKNVRFWRLTRPFSSSAVDQQTARISGLMRDAGM